MNGVVKIPMMYVVILIIVMLILVKGFSFQDLQN